MLLQERINLVQRPSVVRPGRGEGALGGPGVQSWHRGDQAGCDSSPGFRHRTKITKGPSSRAAGLAMAFKLLESAQARWRAVNAPHLVALVRAGARFEHGRLVERGERAA